MTSYQAISRMLLMSTSCLWCTATFAQTTRSDPASELSDIKPTSAVAADPKEQAAAASPAGDDIIVTAEKRAEGRSAQRVPISVVTLGGDTLARNQLSNIAEVSKVASNVALVGSSANSFPNFFIRGLGVSGTVRTIDPAVGVFVDGIYIGFGPSALVDNFDIAGIEVLRGPQGTLFGRNVSGGAIVVNTKRPGHTFAVDTRATIQTDGVYDAAAAVDVPLGSSLYSRVVGVFSHEDGYFYDRVSRHHDAQKNLILLRPSFRFEPSGDLTIDLIGEYQRNHGGAGVGQFLARPGAPTLAERVFLYAPPADKYDVDRDDPGFQNSRIAQITLKADWNVGPGLISLVSGYRDLRVSSDQDSDATPFVLLELQNLDKQHQKTVELRYASNTSGPFQFTLGGYYFQQAFRSGEERKTFTGVTATGGTTFSRTAAFTRENDSSYAAFAQGEYHITDPLSVVAGVRYTNEGKSIQFSPPGTCALGLTGSCSTSFPGSKHWSKVTPKVGVNWQATSNTLVYASYTQGFRSGAFNARAQRLATLGPADPETATNYEAGLKTSFFNQHLRVSLSAFSNTVTNLQKIVPTSYDPDGPGPLPATLDQLLLNAGKVLIRGSEADVQANAGRFSLRSSIGYLDTKYKSYSDPGVAARGKTFQQLRLERSPKWTFSINPFYTVQVGDGLTARASVNYSYTSSYFNDTYNTSYLTEKSHGIVDATLSLARGSRWEVIGFVKNLTNVNFTEFRAEVATLTTAAYGGLPRRFGLQAKTHF